MRRNSIGWIGIRIILSLFLIWALIQFATPFQEYRETRMQIDPLQKQAEQYKSDIKTMQRRLDAINTKEGLKAEAHRVDLISPGERRIVFKEAPSAKAGIITPADPEFDENKQPALFTRMTCWVTKEKE